MMIEFFSSAGTDRVLVTMEAAELDGYGVSFSAMSLGDPPTRAMLRDLLAMVDRMGLHSEGEKVQVECAQTGEGGCALLISRVSDREEKYYFCSCDDIIAAYLAGALPEGEVNRRDGCWEFIPGEVVSKRQRILLGQFCCPSMGE